MRVFKAFVMDDNGSFIGSHILEDVETDTEAIAIAPRFAGNKALEIWQGDRRVAQVTVNGEVTLFREQPSKRPAVCE